MGRPASGLGKTAILKARITDLEGYLDSSEKELRKADARIKDLESLPRKSALAYTSRALSLERDIAKLEEENARQSGLLKKAAVILDPFIDIGRALAGEVEP